jgi:hypothetical protein
MILAPRRRVLLGAVFGALALLSPTAHGQRIFLRREPTVCSTPFRPNGGFTFHAGGKWAVTWNAPPGQFGSSVFAGYPNPVLSADGTKRWDNPIAFVNCWIYWYLENGGEQAYYDWELLDYSGEVTNCASGSGPRTSPEYFDNVVYDPYDTYDPYGSSTCGGGGGGSGGEGGGGGCVMQYFVVEISYDGGSTWHTLWEGWGTVCG